MKTKDVFLTDYDSEPKSYCDYIEIKDFIQNITIRVKAAHSVEPEMLVYRGLNEVPRRIVLAKLNEEREQLSGIL